MSRAALKQEGREYHYIDRATFERMQQENEFLESANVFGNLYGTARHALTDAAKHGNDLLLDIDVQGAAQVRKADAGFCQHLRDATYA